MSAGDQDSARLADPSTGQPAEPSAGSPADRCHLCGGSGGFDPCHGNLREATCRACGATRRNSDVARVIADLYSGGVAAGADSAPTPTLRDVFPALRKLRIFEAQAAGPIHALLAGLPGYVCSEYFEYVPRGQVRDGVRCEDLMALSFPGNAFDLVITQDVLEHVADPDAAFREIRRVLVPGGHHVFTVPLHPTRPSQTRARLSADGAGGVEHLLPRVVHGDPVHAGGALVFTDFGADLADRLQRIGFRATLHILSDWYAPDEVTWIGDDAAHARHRRSLSERGLLPSFQYNSVVVDARCLKLEQTGERNQPEIRGDMAYEHWHRYLVARDLVAGAVVVDIACGEGYGTALLAQVARRVIGVDVSAEVIAHARERYAHVPGAEFHVGSCTAIPVAAGSADAVVSFETIEHLVEHEAFVAEVLRVLGPTGRFVVSTPNKAVYTDATGEINPFHMRELYLDAFVALLAPHFATVRMLGQRLTYSSHVWPLEGDRAAGFVHYHGSAAAAPDDSARPLQHGAPDGADPHDRDPPVERIAPPYPARYFIAVCDRAAPMADPSDESAAPGGAALDLAGPLPLPDVPVSLFTEPEDDLAREVQVLRQHFLFNQRRTSIAFDDSPVALAREPRLAIVILTRSKLTMLFRCIEAIVTRSRYRNFRLVIGDTGSTEAERKAIAAFLAQYPGLDAWLIAMPGYHFARCNNELARRHAGADAELLLFCNNDVVLVNDAISRLVAVYLQDAGRCGTLGCRLHYESHAIQHAGMQFTTGEDGLRLRHRGLGSYDDYSATERILGNTGAFLMIRRDLFERLGGFDEGYRDTYQDVELNLACILAGRENRFVGSAVAYHYESQTRSLYIPPEDGARLMTFIREHPDPAIERLIVRRPGR